MSDYDVIVIGSGAGGGTLRWHLAGVADQPDGSRALLPGGRDAMAGAWELRRRSHGRGRRAALRLCRCWSATTPGSPSCAAIGRGLGVATPLPLGIDLDQAHPVTSACIRCKTCGGYPCLVKAKSDARTIAIFNDHGPAEHHPAHRAQGEAARDRPQRQDGHRGGLRDRERRGALDRRHRGAGGGRRQLGGGATGQSANAAHPQGLANGSDQVGRNYMFHTLTAMVSLTAAHVDVTFPKTMAVNDFYAIDLRNRIYGALEQGERAEDPALRDEWLTFVVVRRRADRRGDRWSAGGRRAGVAARRLVQVGPDQVRVVLLDAGKRVLSAFDPSLSAKAAAALADLGVTVHEGARVTGIDARGVDDEADGNTGSIPSRTVIWAAGVRAVPLAEKLARATAAERRPRRPPRGPARPEPARASRDLGDRRHREPRGARWQAAPRAGDGRDPAGPGMSPKGSRRANQARRPVPLLRQGRAGGGRPLDGGMRDPRPQAVGPAGTRNLLRRAPSTTWVEPPGTASRC